MKKLKLKKPQTNYYQIWFVLSLLVVSGCQQKSRHHLTTFSCQELEARHYDIPTLLHANLIADRSDEQGGATTFLTYAAQHDFDSAVAFYIQEMERFGWRQLYTVSAYEAMLSFEKPQKFATVSIRPSKKELSIVIVVKAKESFLT